MHAGLRGSGDASAQVAASSHSAGPMPTLSQRPSLQNTSSSNWSGTSNSTLEDDGTANPLHLTPALADECSALVRSLATGNSETPIPEDSAMESSLTGAVSDVVCATTPSSEPPGPPAGDLQDSQREPFRSDSPIDEDDKAATCAAGVAADVEHAKHLPAITESSAAACPAEQHVGAAKEHCVLSTEGHTTARSSPFSAQQPLHASERGVASVESVHGATTSSHVDHQATPPGGSHGPAPNLALAGSAVENLNTPSEPTLLGTEPFCTPDSPCLLYTSPSPRD